jgi:hypothetical protein
MQRETRPFPRSESAAFSSAAAVLVVVTPSALKAIFLSVVVTPIANRIVHSSYESIKASPLPTALARSIPNCVSRLATRHVSPPRGVSGIVSRQVFRVASPVRIGKQQYLCRVSAMFMQTLHSSQPRYLRWDASTRLGSPGPRVVLEPRHAAGHAAACRVVLEASDARAAPDQGQGA